MLKKIQAITGVIFAVFLLMHLLNTWAAGLGPEAYDGFTQVIRPFYQFVIAEGLLLAALATHVATGIVRWVREPKRDLSSRARWHRYAGVFIALVIVGHILAVRGSSWFFDVYPGFAGLAFSIDFAPYYFYPYYFLLALAGFYHGLNGLGIALSRLGLSWRVSRPQLVWATASAAVLTLTALLGLGGVLFDVGDPGSSAFAELARTLLNDFSSL